MRIDAVFEDEWLLVVNKPSGLLSEGGDGVDSLEVRVREQFARTAILMHRLDRPTSGLVLFAKRREIAGDLTRLIEERRIRKAYLAVVRGTWTLSRFENRLLRENERTVARPLESSEGDQALTTFRKIATSEEKSLIEALLKTGRQHQIRVHCAEAGHPIFGDGLYGVPDVGPGLALHAYRLDFQHPKSSETLILRGRPPIGWDSTWLHGLELGKPYEKLFLP